jgi:hypothetical protein
MLAYYGTKISPHMTDTPEGYLICHDVAIARTGDMAYRAAELGLEGDPDRAVTVRRYAEDVFDPAAVASFEGKDVTAGHPAESVGPANHGAYSKGHVQNVRREGEYLTADLLIKDAALISDIKNGVVREVSCGYLCSYTPEGDHYRQEHIRGNHVAVVPRGRAGREVAIQDSAQDAGKGTNTMSKFAKAILTAFGLAAKEAQDEAEVHSLVDTAMTALDAEPAGETAPAPEAAPAVETPAADAAPSALEGKLDEVIRLLKARDSENPTGVEALDRLIEGLKEKEEEKEPEVVPAGGAEDAPLTGGARDAAMAILKHVRPAVASIEDAATRSKVADALLEAVRSPGALEAIAQASRESARSAADAAGQTSFDKLCAEQKAAYDARNPHKKKEDN